MENNTDKEITLSDIANLTQREIELIYFLRNRFKWGEVSLEMRDGQPFRMKKITEYQTLG